MKHILYLTLAAHGRKYYYLVLSEEAFLNRLIHFLIEHMILDFEGEITVETLNRFLREDNSPLARDLKGKLLREREVEDFLVVLADCLRDHIPQAITADVIRDQIVTYVEA